MSVENNRFSKTKVAIVTRGSRGLGRVGRPDDVGPMIAALLSDANSWVNARRIEVSGGMFLQLAHLPTRQELRECGHKKLSQNRGSLHVIKI